MDSILNFISNILVWIAIYAFFKKRTNNSSFWYEYRVAVKNIVAFVKDLLKKSEKTIIDIEPQKDEKTSMQYLAENLNHQVKEMIQYKYPSNYGWRYKADNWVYVITHNKKVDVEILVTSKQTRSAMVLIKNGTVCDVIEQKYGEPKPDAPIPTPVPAPTPIKPKPESAPESTPEPKPESEPAPESDNLEDEKKAVSIAGNYIIDNMTTLNAMANDAVAEGKNSFIIKDLPGNELAWSKIVDELQDCNFVNCKVIGNTIEVGVNLAAPADDGNYDFEKDEKPDREPVLEPAPAQDTAAESETEEENIEIITGSEDFIIPDEPQDIPE